MYFADILEDEVEKSVEKAAKITAEKKAEKNAVACLKDNVPIENVAKWMKLSLEHVKELAAQLEKQFLKTDTIGACLRSPEPLSAVYEPCPEHV